MKPRCAAHTRRCTPAAIHISSRSATVIVGYAYVGLIAPGRAIVGRSRTRSMSRRSRSAGNRPCAAGRADRRVRERRGFRQMIAVIGDTANAGLGRAAPTLRLPHGGHVRECRLQVRPLARQRVDAAPARQGRSTPPEAHRESATQCADQIRLAIRPSSQSGRSDSSAICRSRRSTRSSSCPRRTISPVAETTL